MQDFSQFLSIELDKRKNSNQNYSLRAFARDIGISESFLSQLINKKRQISLALMKKVLDKFHLTEKELKLLKGNHREYFHQIEHQDLDHINLLEQDVILETLTLYDWVSVETLERKVDLPKNKITIILKHLESHGIVEMKDNLVRGFFKNTTTIPQENITSQEAKKIPARRSRNLFSLYR